MPNWRIESGQINENKITLNHNNSEYNRKDHLILRKIREAKEVWIRERCNKLEELQRKHEEFNKHKKIKAFTALSLEHDVMDEWKNYIKDLFRDNRKSLPNLSSNTGISLKS